MASSSDMNSPKHLIATHQTEARTGVPNKLNNISIFDHLDIRKYFVEINGVRCPRDASPLDYTDNDYLNQYRDLKAFFQEYVGEPILSLFINYANLKNFYPIQVIDLRFQVDHISPKKIQLFEECRVAPANARLFVTLIKHRQIKMISDGHKITQVKVL